MTNRKVLVVLLIALIFPALAFSATIGKIKGTVTDRETGEPLPGANVSIVGSTIGAATDINGEYIVLNVPVGVYSVRAQFIGYRDVTISNIKVNSDLTTEIDFALPSEALEVGAVSIVAERPLVNKNATNATRIQSYEEFKNIPVRSVQAVVALQPGVVVQNGNTYIRGGRESEVGYFLEGANTRDPDTGDNVITVIPEALEEFQVQAGGYNAEYGGANAGIVRQSLKTGGNDYRFTFQTETDNFADRGDKFLGTHSYGYTDMTATLSGPLLNKKLKFFIAGQNIFERDAQTRFWEGFDFNHADTYVDERNFPLIFESNRDSTLESFVQSQGISMRDNAIPASARNRWIGNGTLVYDANPFIFRLSGAVSWRRQDEVFGDIPGRLFNLDRVEQEDLSTALGNLKITHLLGPKTFYELNVNYFDRREVTYDPIFEHDVWSYWDSTANAAEGVQFFSLNSPWRGGTEPMEIYGFDFDAPGTPYQSDYTKNKRNYWGGSFALTSQQSSHEIKLGASFERWTARHYSTTLRTSRTMLVGARNNPNQYRAALAAAEAGNLDAEALGEFRVTAGNGMRFTYGYDVFGNEIDVDGVDGPRHPQYFSAFLQDKFEANDIVINAGIRLDVLDNDDFEFVDPSDPPWDRSDRGLFEDQLITKDAEVLVSPRLGLAFPVTDRTVFHMQYGKFVQAPRLTDIYNGSTWYDAIFTGGTSFQTNLVGVGLDAEKTTQYEVGFNQQFSDVSAFDITAYYKNVEDQIQVSRVVADPTSPAGDYNVLTNGDFATTAGIELSLTLRRTNRAAAQINYTFSRSLGTGSVSNSAISGIELGTETPSVISPLDFHRPHKGSITFDYRFGKGDGGPILQQLGLNILANFTSGHPYTRTEGDFGQQDESLGGVITDPRSRRPLEAVNSSLTPWIFELNLRLDKTINFGGVNVNLYGYVQNLLDRQNVVNVYDRTGNAYDDGFFGIPSLSQPVIEAHGGQPYVNLYNALNLNGNGSNYASEENNTVGLLLLGPPRLLRFGARIEL